MLELKGCSKSKCMLMYINTLKMSPHYVPGFHLLNINNFLHKPRLRIFIKLNYLCEYYTSSQRKCDQKSSNLLFHRE